MPQALRQYDLFEDEDRLQSRDQVLARYRQLREVGKRHHEGVLKFVSTDSILRHARRLGLAEGKRLILDDIEEMNFVFDLAIYSASAGRTRAIDRYAKSAHCLAGSDEALMLEAMCTAQFSVLLVDRHHDAAGLVVTDLANGATKWLVDMGLESSLPDGTLMAARLYTPERFCMTAGVVVPFDLDMVEELPRRMADGTFRTVIDDWRFAESLYRIALDGEMTHRMVYQDLPDDA